MAKRTPAQRRSWSDREVGKLRQLAKQNTPTRVIGLKLKRTPYSVYAKAASEGISLKPTNQRPYSRRKTRRR